MVRLPRRPRGLLSAPTCSLQTFSVCFFVFCDWPRHCRANRLHETIVLRSPPIVEFSRAFCLNSRKLPDTRPTQLFVPRRLFKSFARGLRRWISRFAGNARLRSLSVNESAERLFHGIRGIAQQVGSQSAITKSPWILSRQQVIATQRTMQRWCDAGAYQSHQLKACLSMLSRINVRLHARLTEIGLLNMTVKRSMRK
ncbi:hypothetical protein MRX96_023604 [Rhipicephalus microplus]